jgi:hypothetical protein
MPIIIIADQFDQPASHGTDPNPLFAPKQKPAAPVAPARAVSPISINPVDEIAPVQTMRKDEPTPLTTEKEGHDAGLAALLEKFKAAKSKGLVNEQNDILQEVHDYPYKGKTIGSYFTQRLKHQARSMRDKADKKDLPNFPITDPATDVYELLRQVLSGAMGSKADATKITNLPAYMNKLVQFYGMPQRKTGLDRAGLKMQKYVDWFNDPSKTEGRVEGAEGADWEQFKQLAWEQYKKDNWKDSTGRPMNIPAAVSWIRKTALENKDKIPNFWSEFLPFDIISARNKLKSYVDVPDEIANDPQELNKLIDAVNAKKRLNMPHVGSIDRQTPEQIIRLKQLLKNARIDIPKRSPNDVTLEMLDPAKQNLGPLYFDKLRSGAGKHKMVQIDEGRTGHYDDDLVKDDGHRSKYEDLRPKDAYEVSSPGMGGVGYDYKPKQAPKPTAPKPSLPAPYFDFNGSDEEKAKAKARQDLVRPNNPKYKELMGTLADQVFDPSSEKLLHDACQMAGNLADADTGDLQEKAVARQNNQALKSQFAREHEAELAALPGDDNRMKMIQLNVEVWKRIMKYLADDAGYARLNKQYGQAVMASMKEFSRIMHFSARLDLMRK